MAPQSQWQLATVSDLAGRALITMAPDATVREALDRMRAERCGCVLAVEDGRLVGIFTERDVMTKAFALQDGLGASIGDVMSRDPAVAPKDEPIASAASKMLAGGYRHMPIVDDGGRPLGVISVKCMVQYLVDCMPRTIYTASDDGARYPAEQAGA
ncbi:MAG: CBS domain-containing protein [Phycisphaerae bacterium]